MSHSPKKQVPEKFGRVCSACPTKLSIYNRFELCRPCRLREWRAKAREELHKK